MPQATANQPLTTLPDLLKPGLDIVFVGINPGLLSAQLGHYFARKTNRFWPGFSRSRLSLAARTKLGVDALLPEHDRAMPDLGFGFTDIAKRPSAQAAELSRAEFEAGVVELEKKLVKFAPRIACFHGLMGYRHVHRALTRTRENPVLGAQPITLGPTKLFVVPNPSPANAHFTPAIQTEWYDRLHDYFQSL